MGNSTKRGSTGVEIYMLPSTEPKAQSEQPRALLAYSGSKSRNVHIVTDSMQAIPNTTDR